MANIKIAQLTNQIAISDNDLIIVETATSTNKMTVGKLKELLGINVGGIIESGSNANGNYIKYADGTLVMWGITPNESITTAIGSGYRTVSRTSTLPATLHDYTKARIVVSAQNYAIATGNVETNNSIVTAMLSFDSGRNSASHWQVIGRWKA